MMMFLDPLFGDLLSIPNFVVFIGRSDPLWCCR